jgi:Na+-transporting NADH:ubiquinone oxidoreductase subunit F
MVAVTGIVGGLLLVIAAALLVAERLLTSHGECSVTINGERVIGSDGGETLLGLLTRSRLFVPSACGGKATCGFCKVEVVSGGGKLLPTESVYVSREERERGVRLACQVKVEGSIQVRMPESLLAAREYRSKVSALERLTHDTKLVRLALEDGDVRFRPGQYIQLLVPGTEQFRAYSVASPPSRARAREVGRRDGQPEVELIVRYVPGGLCTGWVHRALAVGDVVRFTGPFGDFYLHEDSDRPIVAIGGGSGMAPMRSIVLHLAERGMPRKVTLFFGARARRDLFYTEEFRALERQFSNFRYVPALSEPQSGDNWTGEVGFVTQVADRYTQPGDNMDAVLCGPPPMIEAAFRVLPRKGIPPERVFFDKF